MHAIAFPVMLLFSFCCFDFSFHGIQQEIETVDPLLILVNGPEQRISLPEQEPPQTVMIGDRKHDVLGAKECRVPCIGVRYGYAEAGELEQYGADWVTDSVETLGKLLL